MSNQHIQSLYEDVKSEYKKRKAGIVFEDSETAEEESILLS